MNFTRHSKRKLGAIDPSQSDDEYVQITPQPSTVRSMEDSQVSCSMQPGATERPRRAGVDYNRKFQARASTFSRTGKRRKKASVSSKTEKLQTQPQLPPHDPSRSNSLVNLPLETTTVRKTNVGPEIQEVEELLNGKARSDDLVVNNPNQSTSSPTVSSITLGLSMSYFTNSLGVKLKKAGDLLTHWRQGSDDNHDGLNTAPITERTTTTAGAVINTDQGVTPTDLKTPSLENLVDFASNSATIGSTWPSNKESCTSYVKCNVNAQSEVTFEDLDTSAAESSEDASSQNEETERAPTPPPPPQHGYPGTANAYRENVPVPNAPRWHGTAVVWNNHNQPDSAQVLLDSGSTPNFVSRRLAVQLGFEPLWLPKKEWKILSTVNGQQDLAQHYIKLDIDMKWLDFPRKTQYLLVVENDGFEIILGERFIAEYGIAQKLVARVQAGSSGRAFAIITSKPTAAQVEAILADKERRRKLAERANANIEESRQLKRGPDAPSGHGISHTGIGSTVESAGNKVYGPKITSTLNSFKPAMGRDQGDCMPVHRQTSMASSSGSSSTDNSFDSSPRGSVQVSPATTFSSSHSTRSESFNLDRLKKKLSNPFNSKGKEQEIG